MTQETIVGLATQTINTLFMIASPVLVAAMVVGILISIFQTATSISDQTLTFVPKIMIVLLVLLITFPWMIQVLTEFAERLFSNLHNYVR